MYINIHIWLKWIFIWADIIPSKSERLLISNLNTRDKMSHSVVQETPRTTQPLLLALIDPKSWKITPYCWRHHSLQTQSPKGPELHLSQRISSLRTRIDSTTRCHTNFQRRKVIKKRVLFSYNVYEPHQYGVNVTL